MNTQKQITLMVAMVFLLLGGCAAYTVYDQPREEHSATGQQATLADRGGRIFARYCRQCHGSAGEGRVGPQLSRDDLRDLSNRTETQLWVTDTITCGRIGKVMPPWAIREGGALTDEQIRDLVSLVTGAPPGGLQPSQNYWDRAAEYSREEGITAAKATDPNATEPLALQPVTDVLAAAAITGAGTTRVCGQFAPATPEAAADNGQLPAGLAPKDQWTQVTTDNKFSVTAIAIDAGKPATVAQDNQGKALHNFKVLGPDNKVLKDDSGKDITTPLTDPGKQASITFTLSTPGVYNYQCEVHPLDMTGKLYVVGPDGTAGSGGAAATGTPAAGAVASAPAGGGAANTTLAETMTDNKYSQPTLTVPSGKAVTLTVSNKGTGVHNLKVLDVKDDNGNDIKTDLVEAGKSATIIFTISKKGTYKIQCDVHPVEMTGTFIVQ